MNFIGSRFEVYDLPLFIKSIKQLKIDIGKNIMTLDQIGESIALLNPEMYCNYSEEIEDYGGLDDNGKKYVQELKCLFKHLFELEENYNIDHLVRWEFNGTTIKSLAAIENLKLNVGWTLTEEQVTIEQYVESISKLTELKGEKLKIFNESLLCLFNYLFYIHKKAEIYAKKTIEFAFWYILNVYHNGNEEAARTEVINYI